MVQIIPEVVVAERYIVSGIQNSTVPYGIHYFSGFHESIRVIPAFLHELKKLVYSLLGFGLIP